MHEESFPQSDESVTNLSARFEQQLAWEERIGTGFRRRERRGSGDPFAVAADHTIDIEPTRAELVAAWMAGFGTMLGGATLFYKPLLLAFPSLVLILAGAAVGGYAQPIARIGAIVWSVCFFLGMLLAISFDLPVA